MKRCPYCAEEIQDEAIRCRYCGSMLAGDGIGGVGLPPPPDDEVLQYTHSGRRYLLGYGRDFFGVWDRTQSGGPVSRYPRTDEGWQAAWLAFAAREPESSEVAMGAAPAGASASGQDRGTLASSPSTSRPLRRRVSAAWWLLPIFMGWLGGLIAWLVNRDVDPDRARAMLITGIAISVVVFLLVVIQASSTAP